MNASSETWQMGNQAVQVSHLENVYWPRTGFTKGELLGYYRQIAPVILPYLKDRPVTLRMYPQGVEQNSLGRNTAAPYTLRAHPDHPTVYTPLTWEELDADTIHPASFSPQVVLERISRMGDLFTPVLQADQHID